jgi:hypothetical protein
MPLFQYFGRVGSFLLAGLFAASWWFSGNVADAPRSRAPLSDSIHIHSDHKWPERVVFDTSRAKLAPGDNSQAETEPQGQEASQEPVAERHNPIEAFAEMGRETVEDCSVWPTRIRNRTLRRSARPPSSGLGVSRAAKAFTAPNPFHKLPGKS